MVINMIQQLQFYLTNHLDLLKVSIHLIMKVLDQEFGKTLKMMNIGITMKKLVGMLMKYTPTYKREIYINLKVKKTSGSLKLEELKQNG